VLSGYRLGLWGLFTSYRLLMYWCWVRDLHSDRDADGHIDTDEDTFCVLQLRWQRVLSGHWFRLWRL